MRPLTQDSVAQQQYVSLLASGICSLPFCNLAQHISPVETVIAIIHDCSLLMVDNVQAEHSNGLSLLFLIDYVALAV